MIAYNAIIEAGDNMQLEMLCSTQLVDVRSCHKLVQTSPLGEQLLREVKSRTLFVFGFKKHVTEVHLFELFEAHIGPVESARIVRNSSDNRSKGFGFVVLSHQRSIQRSLEIDCILLEGLVLKWSLFTEEGTQSLQPRAQPQEGFNKNTYSVVKQTKQSADFRYSGTEFPIQKSNQLVAYKIAHGSKIIREHDNDSIRNPTPYEVPQVGYHADHQYKFNRSRIISSAAVREFDRRTTRFARFSQNQQRI